MRPLRDKPGPCTGGPPRRVLGACPSGWDSWKMGNPGYRLSVQRGTPDPTLGGALGDLGSEALGSWRARDPREGAGQWKCAEERH